MQAISLTYLKPATHEGHQRLGFLFAMFCQAFTAADFSCCLFVGLSAFSFVFSEWNACSIRLKSGDWLCRILNFFTFKNSRVAFTVCFGSPSSICTMKHRPIQPFGWIWAESIPLYTSEWIRLLLSSVTSSPNTSNPVPLEAMHTHAITALPGFTDDVVCFGSWAVPSLFHTFFFLSFWYRLNLISAVQRMLFQKWF